MNKLFGVMHGNRITYTTDDEENAKYVASKQEGDFVTLYAFHGNELTTFNIEPHTVEETHDYINRLVAMLRYVKDQLEELRFAYAGRVAEYHNLRRITNKLNLVLQGKRRIDESQKEHLLVEIEGAMEP